MFIAQIERIRRIVRGSQVRSQTAVQSTLTCPSCGGEVEYNPSPEDVFRYFEHADGSPDCFENATTSDEHRLAVEASVQAIYNRFAEMTDEPIEIDAGRQVGDQSNFITADVRAREPFRVTAEIFYKVGDLCLRRRFKTLSEHDYSAFLIIHNDGEHDAERINRYMSRVSRRRVGCFSPDSTDIVLGDMFSKEQINFSEGDKVPNYLIYTH